MYAQVIIKYLLALFEITDPVVGAMNAKRGKLYLWLTVMLSFNQCRMVFFAVCSVCFYSNHTNGRVEQFNGR